MTLLRIERRDVHETMRAAFGPQVPVRVRALDGERRAADTRLVAGRRVDDLRAIPVTLGPAQVHAHEHLRPVRGVGATDASADREHRVALVVRAGELRLERGFVDLLGQRAEVALKVGVHRRIVRQRRELGEIVDPPPEAVPSLDACAHQADALQDGLRALAIVPEIGTRRIRL